MSHSHSIGHFLPYHCIDLPLIQTTLAVPIKVLRYPAMDHIRTSVILGYAINLEDEIGGGFGWRLVFDRLDVLADAREVVARNGRFVLAHVTVLSHGLGQEVVRGGLSTALFGLTHLFKVY